jgi:ectoine hydroxylase-related dioxygenase (phytanoyl-CoA dioxygenase family)
MTSDAAPGYLSADDCRLADLIDLVNQKADLADYPCAAAVEQNMPIYDGARLRKELSSPAGRLRVEAELARALLDGPGIVVLAAAFDDPWIVDQATRQFEAIIATQRVAGGATADHFAAAGQNDRIWNALEKLALRAPEVFADYYANHLIAAVCRAWLGPGYQVTSQINVVNPGGAAQTAHRDYHLGFASAEQAARFPAHVHQLSPVLTFQGAVAHTDMATETSPTMYLPHSQKYLPGYLAWRQPEFREYFEASRVQLPLAKGERGVLQPSRVPRGRRQPHRRRQAHGQPAAGVVGVRAGHGDRRPERGVRGGAPGSAGQGRRRSQPSADRECHRGLRGGLCVPHQPGPGPALRRPGAAHPGGHPQPGGDGKLVAAAAEDRTRGLEWPPPEPEATVSRPESASRRRAGET